MNNGKAKKETTTDRFLAHMREGMTERDFFEYRKAFRYNLEMQFVLDELDDIRSNLNHSGQAATRARGRPPKESRA